MISLGRTSLLVLLFMTALAIRLYGITDPPLDFHPTKQYRSAITTRAYYYENETSVPEWQREVARDSLRRIGVIVPTPQEQAIARIYQLTGGEKIWIGRVFSVFCWLVGGVFVYALGRRISSFEGAFVGTSFYLLLPFSVVASQSFQPDPLMVMAMLISIYLSLRYNERPGRGRFAAAAGAAALAVFIKPISMFLVLAGFVGSALGMRDSRGKLRPSEVLAVTLIAAGPSVAFYLYRILIHSYAEWGREASFLPSYTLRFEFWDGWLKRLRISLGFVSVVAGLIGAFLARLRLAQCLLLALWVGYLVMCFSVSYKISTHDYYHLPLIPIVALALTQFVDPLVEAIPRGTWTRLRRMAIWGAVFVGLFVAAGTSVQARRRVPDVASEVALAKTVGELVEHSTRTVLLAPYYGRPLMYYGELSGDAWPYRYDIRDEKLYGPSPRTAEERLTRMRARGDVDFFIVLDRAELWLQPELMRFLNRNFPIFSESAQYVIYDLRSGPVSQY